MRGGVTLHELLHIYSHEDRLAIYKVIEDNFEMSKNAGTPIL